MWCFRLCRLFHRSECLTEIKRLFTGVANMKPMVSLAVLVAVVAARGEAENLLQSPDSAQKRAPRWGLTTTLGFGGSGGDFGDLLTKPQSGDYNIFKSNGAWRYGLGISFGSFAMKEPYQDEKEWGFQETYLFATRMLKSEVSVRPYIQGRGGLARRHPRSELLKILPPPESPGDSPTHPTNGVSFGVVPGVEFRLNRSLALDVSGLLDYFHVSEYDLSPVGLAPKSSGTKYEARFGFRWHPDDGWPSGPPGPDAPARQRDAWGAAKEIG